MKDIDPTENIAMNQAPSRRRGIAVILLLIIGIGAIAFGLWQGLGRESGWTQIEAPAGADSFQAQISLLYDLSPETPTADFRGVTKVYAEASRRAYRVFDAYGSYTAEELSEGNNLAAVNGHPNTAVGVDPWLYAALQEIDARMNADDARFLYLAPVYAQYDSLFHCLEDVEAGEFDPEVSEEAAVWTAEVLGYVNDPAQVRLEFPTENTVRLVVSEEYLAFAEENQITAYLDFWQLKHAFAMDAIGRALTEAGYSDAVLSSADGFVLCLDARGTPMALSLSKKTVSYTGPAAAAVLTREPQTDTYDDRFYVYQDGRVVSACIDPADGRCKTRLPELALLCAYGDDAGPSCGLLALEALEMQVGRRELSAASPGVRVLTDP